MAWHRQSSDFDDREFINSNPALGKQWSRDYPIDVPATPTPLPDANLRYQEALAWRKCTKGGCSFLLLSAQFWSSSVSSKEVTWVHSEDRLSHCQWQWWQGSPCHRMAGLLLVLVGSMPPTTVTYRILVVCDSKAVFKCGRPVATFQVKCRNKK